MDTRKLDCRADFLTELCVSAAVEAKRSGDRERHDVDAITRNKQAKTRRCNQQEMMMSVEIIFKMDKVLKLQKEVQRWQELHKESGELAETVCKKLNNMSFVTGAKINALNAGVAPSALLSKAIDMLSDSQDQLSSKMDDLLNSFEKISTWETKLSAEPSNPIDFMVITNLVEQIKQQTLLDSIVMEKLSIAGYDAAIGSDVMTTMMSCFLYSPYVSDIDLDQFIALKID